jgi:opacity protein-like surface antigen
MKSLLKLSALALVATLLFAGQASAEGMSWSLYGGMSNPTGEGSPDGSFAARANLLYQATPVIGVGGELGYHKFGSEDVDFGGGPVEVSSSMWQFTPTVKAQSITGSIRPYGIGGLGMYSFRVSVDGTSESDTNFGFNLGGGAEFGTGPTTFGVEARWHSISTEGESTDMISFMGGINFH